MILVTGATGRIGRYLVDALLGQGKKVRVLARDGKRAHELWGGRVEAFIGDVTDAGAVSSAVKGCDTVFHLAALLDYSAPRDEMFRANVDGTRNVLEAAKGCRIIHMSSTSVYGRRARSPVTEETPFAPEGCYGESKVAADNLARAAGAIVLRPTVVYGPGFTTGFLKLFSMIRKGRMVIAGNGKNRMQWTHIDDLVSAVLLAAEKGMPGEAYNAVSDDVKTQEEFLAIMAGLLKARAPRRHVPMWLLRTFGRLLVKREFIEVMASDRVFDCSRAKRELGWQPKVGFGQGIRGMLEEQAQRERPERK